MAITEAERVARGRARRIEIEQRIGSGVAHRAWVARWQREFAHRWVVIDDLYYERDTPEAIEAESHKRARERLLQAGGR